MTITITWDDLFFLLKHGGIFVLGFVSGFIFAVAGFAAGLRR